jgi:DNA-binding NarL/FixJ family response regulator
MTMAVIHLLLVDDHPASREPLAMLLEREPDLIVVGQAGTLTEARQLLVGGMAVDIAVVDLDLPDGHGSELIRDLRRTAPEAAALVLTASRERWRPGRRMCSTSRLRRRN